MFLTGPKSPKKYAAKPITVIKGAARPAILEIPLVSAINLTISNDSGDHYPPAHCFRMAAAVRRRSFFYLFLENDGKWTYPKGNRPVSEFSI